MSVVFHDGLGHTFADSLRVSAVIRRAAFVVSADVELRPGEVVSIAGANGSGKSTLLMAIAGLLAVDSGRIAIGDVVLDDAQTDTFIEPERRGFAACFQDARLFPHMSVLDNVAFPARCAGMSKQQARDHARPVLERWRIEQFADRRPPQLSGGQQRLVSLARATSVLRPVLLLDEPTANLDTGVKQFVREQLLAERAINGQITIIVSHDVDDAAQLATRALTMADGRVHTPE